MFAPFDSRKKERKRKNLCRLRSTLPEMCLNTYYVRRKPSQRRAAVSNQGKKNALLYIYIYIYYSCYATTYSNVFASRIKIFHKPMYTIRLFTKRTPLRRARRGRRATFAAGVLNLSPPTRSLSFPLKIQTIRSIATPTYSVFQRVRIRISPISTRLFALLRINLCAKP